MNIFRKNISSGNQKSNIIKDVKRESNMIRDAKWISCPADMETPKIIKIFDLEKPKKGRIEICGLGFFELLLNGERVSGDLLVPVLSDYRKRDLTKFLYPINDEPTYRIYYLSYDLENFKDGENIFEITLGNGWYRQNERIAEGNMSFGDELIACFCAEFDCENAKVHVASDGSELCVATNITFSNLFLGEIHDARLADSRPVPVKIMPAPEAELTLQRCPADRVIRKIDPLLIKDKGTSKIYDAGENISGLVRVKTSAPAGTEIKLIFSEETDAQGELDPLSAGSNYICAGGARQIQTDTFISGGEPSVFCPKFVFHAFRFFEIIGDFDELEVLVIHSDVKQSSSFECDNELLNWFYNAYVRTQLDNMHSGVPSDCPHRERLGYTGDGQITIESSLLTLDARLFYEKWIQDILDCQCQKSGHVQHTAPFMGGGGGPGGWGCAIVIVPYAFYKHFGDKTMLERCYEPMKHWITYLESRCENGLVVREEDGGWCLGDWASLGDVEIAESFVNTYYFAKVLEMLSEIAEALGRTKDIEKYAARSEEIKAAIIREFYNEKTGSFCNGVQATDAYALDLEQGGKRTLQNLIKKYEALNTFDAGFIGTDILIDVLFKNNCFDLALSLLTNENDGSFAAMKNAGATTLWEYFPAKINNDNSHNHPMFGAPARHLFKSILGIGQADESAGFESLIIEPCFPEILGYAKGYVTVQNKEIHIEWTKKDNFITISITIPDLPARFIYDQKKYGCGGEKKIVPLHAGRNTIEFFM